MRVKATQVKPLDTSFAGVLPYRSRYFKALTEPLNKERPERARTVGPRAGRLLALDLGQKRIGVAVSDEMRLSARPIEPLLRTSWKQLLLIVAGLVKSFDASGLVIGLPLSMDGSENDAARAARRIARNFALSLNLPVYLQDERLTSLEAAENLRASGYDQRGVGARVDSESAALILRDFLAAESEGLPAPENSLD